MSGEKCKKRGGKKAPQNAKAAAIERLFIEKYRGAKTELHYKNPYELLVCVMLSAQCTDKRVNLITPGLFAAFPNISALANAPLEALKSLIASCSFFNTKAANLIAMARQVMRDFGGEIPLEREALKSLSGVGQKTANVVLIELCQANFMAVDTHVFRVSHRLGLSRAKDALKTESDLNAIFPHNRGALHQAFVLFGRYICKAAAPCCFECFAFDFCIYKQKLKMESQ